MGIKRFKGRRWRRRARSFVCLFLNDFTEEDKEESVIGEEYKDGSDLKTTASLLRPTGEGFMRNRGRAHR